MALKQDGVQFAFCPKQGNKIEGVVLTRVCTSILGIFCPKHGQGFKLSAAHLHPNISRVPPGVTTLSLNNTVFALTFSTLHWQDKMTSGQALLVKLAKLVKELLQKLPYWWKLPIVLMMFYQIRQRDYLLSNNLFDAYSSQHTGPKYDCQDPLIGKYYYIKHNFTQEVDWGARDGAVVRALASYQCGFKPRRRRSMWVAFVVGSLPCSEKFFSGYSSFPLFSKTNISKFQFDQESGRRRTTLWMC